MTQRRGDEIFALRGEQPALAPVLSVLEPLQLAKAWIAFA